MFYTESIYVDIYSSCLTTPTSYTVSNETMKSPPVFFLSAKPGITTEDADVSPKNDKSLARLLRVLLVVGVGLGLLLIGIVIVLVIFYTSPPTFEVKFDDVITHFSPEMVRAMLDNLTVHTGLPTDRVAQSYGRYDNGTFAPLRLAEEDGAVYTTLHANVTVGVQQNVIAANDSSMAQSSQLPQAFTFAQEMWPGDAVAPIQSAMVDLQGTSRCTLAGSTTQSVPLWLYISPDNSELTFRTDTMFTVSSGEWMRAFNAPYRYVFFQSNVTFTVIKAIWLMCLA